MMAFRASRDVRLYKGTTPMTYCEAPTTDGSRRRRRRCGAANGGKRRLHRASMSWTGRSAAHCKHSCYDGNATTTGSILLGADSVQRPASVSTSTTSTSWRTATFGEAPRRRRRTWEASARARRTTRSTPSDSWRTTRLCGRVGDHEVALTTTGDAAWDAAALRVDKATAMAPCTSPPTSLMVRAGMPPNARRATEVGKGPRTVHEALVGQIRDVAVGVGRVELF